MPGAELQAFFDKADYPQPLLERAREIAKKEGH
jgi:hypothetical protein